MKTWFCLPVIALVAACGSPGSTNRAGGNSAEGSPAPTSDAAAFLKWSMDKNAALTSYSAKEDWSMMGSDETREISYVRPNKFKISSTNRTAFNLTAVSNGNKLVEYSSVPGQSARSYDSPSGIWAATSMQMQHPMFDGSLLYQFFGGSTNYDKLMAEDKGKIQFGSNEKANEEPARTVKFYGAGTYGNVEALIGITTGLVYRIRYDSAGLMAEMAKHPEMLKMSGGKVPALMTTETYHDIQTNKQISDTAFDCTPPSGTDVSDSGSADSPKPPVALGTPAPDVEVTGMDGSKMRLSSLKGKIVLIDFWATWCPPCRESLPITNKMHTLYASKGLQVVTVSDETHDVVSAFVKKNKYTFPTFLDPGGKASRTYKVNAIPCLVVVDAAGNLSSYSVGLEPEEDVVKNLRKAGLKI